MTAVKPLMGLPNGTSPLQGSPNGVNPLAAAQALAHASAPGFPSFLTNILDLLQSLFAAGATAPQEIQVPKDTTPQATPEVVKVAPKEKSDATRVSVHDTKDVQDKSHADIRKEIERRLSEIPYDQLPVQISAIRQALQKLDAKGIEGGTSGSDAGQTVDQIVKSLQDLLPRNGTDVNLSQPETPAPTPVDALTAAQVGAKKSFASALETSSDATAAPVAPSTAPALKPVQLVLPKAATPIDDAMPVQILRTPPPPAPSAPTPVLTAPETPPTPAVGAHPAPPAPIAPQIPVDAMTVSVTAPSATVQDTSAPIRVDGAVRGIGTADVRRSEVFSSGSRVSQSETAAPDTDRVEFVERLMRAAKLAQTKGQAQLKMVLNPPRLGSVKVDLSVRDRILNGSLKAANDSAKEMILSNLNDLKESLKDQGIKVGNLTVGVDRGFEGAQGDVGRRASGDSSGSRSMSSDRRRSSDSSVESVPMMRSAGLQLIDVMA